MNEPRTRVPEMKMLSDNECPNAGPNWIFGDDCQPGTLTLWGYCALDWERERDRIPSAWIERVNETLTKRKHDTNRRKA